MREDCGANVNIALNLGKVLRNNGHKVYSVVRQNLDNNICEEYRKYFDDVYVITDLCYNKLFDLYNKNEWKKRNTFYKIIEYIKRPYLLPFWVDWKLIGDASLKREYVRNIKKFDDEYSLDGILAFSFPHWTEEVISKARTKASKGIFKLDPYIYHRLFDEKKIKKRLKEEKRILKNVDKVFVTDLMMKDLQLNDVDMPFEKFCEYQFPGIIVGEEIQHRKKMVEPGGDVHIYFVGRLYEDIRNPEFIFRLFMEMSSKYILHIVGSGADNTVNKYKEQLKDRLVLHGAVSASEAYELMNNADILLNIGNTIDNQLPSKVFDYINTGLPILNCCKLRDCPSLTYLKRYPLAYSFCEEEVVTKKLLVEIEHFIEQSLNKNVLKEDIVDIFSDCTDKYLADLVIEKLKKDGD